MLTILKDVKQTARKDHTCDLCECSIAKGTEYRKQTNVYCGQIYDFKTHLECDELAELLDLYEECDDGVTSYDFEIALNECFCDDPNYFKKTNHDKVLEILSQVERCKKCEYCQFDKWNDICGCGYNGHKNKEAFLDCPKQEKM